MTHSPSHLLNTQNISIWLRLNRTAIVHGLIFTFSVKIFTLWQRWNHQSHNKRIQQISAEGISDWTRLALQGDTLEDVQEFKFDHTNKWYMNNPTPVLENNTHKPQMTLIYRRITDSRPDNYYQKKKKKREITKLSTLLSRLTTE